MPRPTKEGRELTPGQALYVVGRLLKDRRVSSADVSRIVGEMDAEISDLEQRLSMLRSDTSGSSAARGSRAASGSRASATRASRPVSPETAASRKIQGEYMGLIRHLSGAQRARYKKVAKTRGREAAIKEMRSALSK